MTEAEWIAQRAEVIDVTPEKRRSTWRVPRSTGARGMWRSNVDKSRPPLVDLSA